MFSFDLDNITKGIGVVTASLALIGGGYTLYDKLGIEDPILAWAPEYFEISDGPADGELEIRDSEFIVHPATPSITKFSGPANDKIDKFGYKITLEGHHKDKVALGEATLLAHIDYECPEGPVVVNYPDHPNLKFNITK
jgi:hypothetical protein